MAAPYVAGGIALMQQIAEEELGENFVNEIENLIQNHSTSIYDGDDENAYNLWTNFYNPIRKIV